ncbi:MAG: hypothetical protein UIC45_03605 [Paludibacteraceae bacterium]|nr:hypothetical protein [Paludibacteraceae bacterium]
MALNILVAIFNVVFGQNYLPMWAFLVIEIVSVLCAVYFLLYGINKEQKKLENKISDLNDSLNILANDIKLLINDRTTEIFDNLLLYKNILSNDIQNSEDKLSALLHKDTELVKEEIKDTNNCLLNKISEQSEQIAKTSDLINSNIKEVSLYVKDQFTNQTDLIKETINTQVDRVNIRINDSASEIISKTENLTGDLVGKTEEIKSQIIEKDNNLSELVNSSTNSMTQSILDISKKTDLIKETINTQVDRIDIRINDSASEIISKTENLTGDLVCKIEEIKSQIIENDNNFNKLISAGIEKMSQQNIDIHNRIELKGSEIFNCIDYLNEELKQVDSEIKSKVSETENNLSELVNSSKNSISQSILNIEKQNLQTFNLINDSIQESDKSTEEFLACMQKQYELLNIGISEIGAKTDNIRDEINNNNSIITSVKTLISTFSLDIKNVSDDINKKLLENKYTIESNINELNNLQILLRTLLKLFEENTNKKLNNNQERVEKIIDDETKNIVYVYYSNGNIVKSIMNDSENRKLYELEYSNGVIVRSKNYDLDGKLTIEQTFYKDGQVHFRNEYTSKGKIVTEFDVNGKKK